MSLWVVHIENGQTDWLIFQRTAQAISMDQAEVAIKYNPTAKKVFLKIRLRESFVSELLARWWELVIILSGAVGRITCK